MHRLMTGYETCAAHLPLGTLHSITADSFQLKPSNIVAGDPAPFSHPRQLGGAAAASSQHHRRLLAAAACQVSDITCRTVLICCIAPLHSPRRTHCRGMPADVGTTASCSIAVLSVSGQTSTTLAVHAEGIEESCQLGIPQPLMIMEDDHDCLTSAQQVSSLPSSGLASSWVQHAQPAAHPGAALMLTMVLPTFMGVSQEDPTSWGLHMQTHARDLPAEHSCHSQ